MSHKIAISLVGAAIGAGLLSMSSASAAPINGAVIGKVASTDALTQKVVWRGRGVGWRGYGWRRGVGVGVVGAGLATAAAYGAYSAYNNGYDNYAYDTSGYGYSDGYGNNYGYRWRPGWRVASADQNYNYGSQNYNYGYASNYNSRNYNSGNWDRRGTYVRPGVAAATYAATPGYGYGNNSGYASNYNAGSYGYRNNYGSGYYGQGGVASAVAGRPYIYGSGNNSGYAGNYNAGNYSSQTTYSQPGAAATTSTAPTVASGRWTKGYCINAVRERFGISSTDAGKSTNAWAVRRCMEGGPMKIG